MTKLPDVVQQQPTLLDAITSVAAQDGDVAKLEKLMDLYERDQERRAKMAFAGGFANMQTDLPIISKKGRAHRDQKYARWEDIKEAITPVLSHHGFALNHHIDEGEGSVRVTAILRHREGHQEETGMTLPFDTSGSKNPIQAIASAISYGQRYTTTALLGLAATGEDDDGNAAGAGPKISEEQVMELRDFAEANDIDVPRFCKYHKVDNLEDIAADHFADALNAMKRKAGK
jgi:hypothetical protein